MAHGEEVMMDKEYEAQDDCRALLKAEEIKKDPKRMKAAMYKLKEKKKAITSIEQLKGVAMDYEEDMYKKDMKKDMDYKKDMKGMDHKGMDY